MYQNINTIKMPFYTKQSLLRGYHRWNTPKKRNLDRYIKVIYGKTFLSELQMNLGKKKQDKLTAAKGRSQQAKRADNRSSKQEKPSDLETNATKDEGSLQETVTKEMPRGKHYTSQSHGSQSREKGSSGGVMTRKGRESRKRAARDVSSSTELTEEASKNKEEGRRVVEDKLSVEQKEIYTSRTQRKSPLKWDPPVNTDETELDLPVINEGFDFHKIQALNADAESTTRRASESHHQFPNDQDEVLSSSENPGVTGQLVLGFRGRIRKRKAFSPQQKRRSVTRQRFPFSRNIAGNKQIDGGDTETNLAITPQPSSTSDSEVKDSVSDSAEGSSTALMQGGSSQERAIAAKRVIRIRQTARTCFPKLSQSTSNEYGDKRSQGSQLTDAHKFSSTPDGDRRLGSAPFSRRVSVEVHRLKEPIDCGQNTLTNQVDSFSAIGIQDDTKLVDRNREAVEEDASSDDTIHGGKKSQDPRDEDLWNLSVVSAIEDIPLLEDDDKMKSSQSETEGPQLPTKAWHHVAAKNQQWNPGGYPSQSRPVNLECKPENDNDESVIDESVEDDKSIFPTNSYLPGLSHIHDGLLSENPPPCVDSPIFPILGLLRQPVRKRKQGEITNKTVPTTRSRSPTNFPVGNSRTKNNRTPPEAEQTEKISPKQRRSPTGRPVATENNKDQLEDSGGRSQTTLNTDAVTSTRLAPRLPVDEHLSLKTDVKMKKSSSGETKKMEDTVSMGTLVKDETFYTSQLEEPKAVPRKIKTPAEKKQRWSNIKQEDQLLSSSPTKKETDFASGEKDARKRKRNDSQEMRGHSGWEESLRQKPATVARFQAGEISKSTKKPETEKKRWQPPPSKKMKLSEGSDHAHKSSEEEELSVPIAFHVSTPRPPPVLQDKYRYGEMIWGKMKGFNWWPGTVVHHHACGCDAAPSDACWVKWHGDDKFSKLNLSQVTSFFKFTAHFSQSTFLHTALYRRAVFQALLLASTRAGKTYSSDPAQYKTEVPKRSRKLDPTWQTFYELCNDMIRWAKEGFKPGGKDAIMPDEGEQQPPPRPPSPPPSPVLSTPTKKTSRSPSKSSSTWKDIRDIVIPEVHNGTKCIEDICIGCGSFQLTAEHPFFIGGLCECCRVEFVEMAYVFDEDGYQCFCCICAEGSDIILCDQPECYRSFCHDCMKHLVGPDEVQAVLANSQWKCYMCNPEPTTGLLTRRKDWPQKLLLFFQQDLSQNFPPMRAYPPVEMDQRKPIRVLSLFDGIGTGMLVLKELGVKVDCYYASEINEEAMRVSSVRHDGIIQQMNDITKITEQEIKSLGPFDLLIGGSPCNDLSIANPARKGLFEGTGQLFFEFYRLLTAVRPEADNQRPFFWLFENVVGMAHKFKVDISRFLQCDPVVVDAKDVSPAHRARYFWGNLPGMNRPNVATEHNALCLQDCLEPNCNRQAQFSKVRTVTSKLNSIKQKNEQVLPVLMNGQEDALWCTEMERIFGFPDHYTDIANMSRTSRHKLIGQAWSVPVIKHLLAPLKEYFACETHE